MRLLLVEDDPADARLIREFLKDAPPGTLDLKPVDRLSAALDALQTESFDAVLLDLGLPDSQGLDTLRAVTAAHPALAVVALTGLSDERVALDAVRAGAQDYLVKGRVNSELLIRTLRYAVERQRVEKQLRQLNDELELRVRERTAQLEAANQELEAFSYSVSHDLRTPLRAIDGFSRVLLEDCAAWLDATAQKHLDRIRAAAQRMGLLIDDLLNLSRVSRSHLQPQTVNLSALVQAKAAELQRAEPHRTVEFAIVPHLRVVGDARLLQVAMDNLLDNAWKFSRHTEHPRIEFGVRNLDGEPVFFVRDNGAGFDMQYAAKLFGAFQRLHSEQEFEGTGIGLATVQRIIHRHGGRIWAEATINRGATFYFTFSPSTPNTQPRTPNAEANW